MNGFLELGMNLGLPVAVCIPICEIKGIDIEPDPHSTGGCAIHLKDGTILNCTDGQAWSKVKSALLAQPYDYTVV